MGVKRIHSRQPATGSPTISPASSPEAPPEALVFWRALRRRWLWPAVGAALGLALGLGVALKSTSLYQARALLELRGLNSTFLDVGEVSPTDAAPALKGEIETAVRLLGGRRLAADVAADLAAESAAGGDADNDAPADAAANLEVHSVGSSRIIEISTRSRSPRVAAEFVNGLAERYLAARREGRRASAESTATWLEARLIERRELLEDSERRLQQYAGSNGLRLGSAGNVDDAEGRLADLESELQAVRSEAFRLRAESETVAANPAGADSELLRARLSRLAELHRRSAELEALYTPEHYQVRQVAAQIAAVELGAEEERARLGSRLGRELAAAGRRDALLAEALAERRVEIARTAALAVRYQTLERETEANRNLYETFLERARQAGAVATAPAEGALLVERATAPAEPVTPGPALTAGAGLVLGLFAGLLPALLLERIDRSFRAPGEIAARLGVNELGFFTKQRRGAERRMTAGGVRSEALRFASERAAGRERVSLEAECYRGLRTSLESAGEGGGPPRSIVITSPAAGDGKTMLAVGLAVSLTELRERVLLVDADLHRPRVHEALGLRNERGLADLLADEELDWETLVREAPGRPGLFALSSGVVAFGGAGLLHSPRMGRLIESFSARFGAVILDAPPVLAVSDARAAAVAAEATVLVIRAEKTDAVEAAEAVRLLRADGAHLAGAVLNGWNPRRSGYGAYGGAEAYFRPPAKKRFRAAA